MASPLDPFISKLDAFTRDLQGDGVAEMLESIGEQSKEDAERAVRGDIGDLSMSGWTHPTKNGPRTNPPQLTARYELSSSTSLEVFPAAKGSWRKGAGPWRVLEEGRSSYAVGDKRVKGYYTSKKTGARTARTKTIKGRVGATKGKGTWSDAKDLIAQTLAEKAQAGFRKMVTRTFGG